MYIGCGDNINYIKYNYTYMKKSKYLKMFDPELAQKLMLEGRN